MTTRPSDGVVAATRRFLAWLGDAALPLWATTGVDRKGGGFIERLTPDGQRIDDVRRARLVARQIFAFKAAGHLGWKGPVDMLVRHGLDVLLNRHLTPDNEVVPRFLPAEGRGEGAFDLYDQAFVLFGLAHGYAHTRDAKLEDTALAVLRRMREQWAQGEGGFVDCQTPKSPLKANPHMHLLEASLAWLRVSANATWRGLAAEVVELCRTRFVDPETGALHEFFDRDWKMLVTPPDDVVEPGHQAEWAWLLLQWQTVEPAAAMEGLAARLLAIAEERGVDSRQHRLVNELNADLSIRDDRLRLWPQTERIKALVAFRELQPGRDLDERLTEAILALIGYFNHPVAGSWWEHFDSDGSPISEPARASSLYHIMGAATELASLTGLRLG